MIELILINTETKEVIVQEITEAMFENIRAMLESI